ncbi:acetyltransferase [Facklamia sp. P13064]|uniref:acetyltransferase n=1 Tax=Facklamia sp. P13064 TaxID=3421953 RepID=UPI003D16437F
MKVNKYKTLVIIGAGGHAKVCYEIALLMNKWDTIIILDDNLENNFFEISGKVNDYKKYLNSADFFVAIGSNETRSKIYEDILEQSGSLATLIHPNAILSEYLKIGEGTVIMPGVIINADSEIGKGVILNTSCTIDHDNNIGDYVHISPGAHLAGNVTVEGKTWVGIGSNIINNIKISKNCIIGAGSLVLTNIQVSDIYIGSPVKKQKN